MRLGAWCRPFLLFFFFLLFPILFDMASVLGALLLTHFDALAGVSRLRSLLDWAGLRYEPWLLLCRVILLWVLSGLALGWWLSCCCVIAPPVVVSCWCRVVCYVLRCRVVLCCVVCALVALTLFARPVLLLAFSRALLPSSS